MDTRPAARLASPGVCPPEARPAGESSVSARMCVHTSVHTYLTSDPGTQLVTQASAWLLRAEVWGPDIAVCHSHTEPTEAASGTQSPLGLGLLDAGRSSGAVLQSSGLKTARSGAVHCAMGAVVSTCCRLAGGGSGDVRPRAILQGEARSSGSQAFPTSVTTGVCRLSALTGL